jgi:uncharacterized protein (DUF1800 family)
MGDANTVLDAAEARHLLRRTGFGAPPREVRSLTRGRGKTRGAAVRKLLRFRPKQPKLKIESIGDAQDQWLQHMILCKAPLQEKLVLFWHDHFATAVATVGNPFFMARQNLLLREHCKGDFRAFLKAINRDLAMMEFLDTVRNRKRVPNENYARELLELFTLGVKDRAGNDTYTQEDIVQIARAFTGWRYEVPERGGERQWHKARPYLDAGRHDFMADFPARGPKVIFRTTGGFGPDGRSFTTRGEGEAESDAVIDVILEHRDSDGKSTVARRIAHRLLEYFAHPEPATAVVDDVVAASGFDRAWDIAALLHAIFVHDDFYATAAAAPLDAAAPKSVKWPVDYVVSTLRLLGMRPTIDKERGLRLEGGSRARLRSHLAEMGQVLFDPPSVFGWDWELAWLSSTTLLARFGFARDVGAARGRDRRAFQPKRIVDLGLTEPGAIVDAVTGVLGVADQLGPGARAALVDYLTDGGATASLDLTNDAVRERKLHGLFTLVLQSPAYQLH